jgi:hypothetical protein
MHGNVTENLARIFLYLGEPSPHELCPDGVLLGGIVFVILLDEVGFGSDQSGTSHRISFRRR